MNEQNIQDLALSPTLTSEALQKDHYERISAGYDAHYNDFQSQKYIRRFILDPMFKGIELENKLVLEAMCGGGQITEYLLEKNARVVGLDISPSQMAYFHRRHNRAQVVCGSMLNSGIKDESFDAVAIIGGIHHLPPHTSESLHEIHRVLKTGGYFCFAEPHSESLAEMPRKMWYKRDSLFAENEAAVNMSELRNEFSKMFDFKTEIYLGNVAYLLVFNSMVFRVPLRLKPFYSPALMGMEGILNRLLGKPFSCLVVAQWQKK